MLKQLCGWFAMAMLVVSLGMFQGCAPEDITAPEQELDESGNPVGSGAMTGDVGEGDEETTEEETTEEEGSDDAAPEEGEGAGLSAEDQALVAAQKLCPVSDEDLGSMGKPVKVMAGEQAVFLCCAACKDAFEKESDKYLAKLAGN